jgi:hypothetical protein
MQQSAARRAFKRGGIGLGDWAASDNLTIKSTNQNRGTKGSRQGCAGIHRKNTLSVGCDAGPSGTESSGLAVI